MKNQMKKILLAVLAAVLSACGSGSDTGGFSPISSNPPAAPPPPASPPPPPAATNYTVTVTSVGITNKDSGEVLIVDGFPIESGTLTID